MAKIYRTLIKIYINIKKKIRKNKSDNGNIHINRRVI